MLTLVVLVLRRLLLILLYQTAIFALIAAFTDDITLLTIDGLTNEHVLLGGGIR